MHLLFPPVVTSTLMVDHVDSARPLSSLGEWMACVIRCSCICCVELILLRTLVVLASEFCVNLERMDLGTDKEGKIRIFRE